MDALERVAEQSEEVSEKLRRHSEKVSDAAEEAAANALASTEDLDAAMTRLDRRPGRD